MSNNFLVAACLAVFASSVPNAECANACIGHGKCTLHEMCICNRKTGRPMIAANVFVCLDQRMLHTKGEKCH
jgi:hypothetical protein